MRTTIFNKCTAAYLLLGCSLLSSCSKENVEIDPQVTSLKANEKMAVDNLQANFVATPNYQLIWSDEFNSSGAFDASKWSYAERGTVAWNKYMTALPAYASQDGSNLLLRMDNATITNDPVAYHAGGVKSMGKFNLAYGKVEVRAKFTAGQGSWPAIWMMPEPATARAASWPGCGEIDIMEHVNNEGVVYQTIHNSTVTNANGGSTASHGATYTQTDYNLYSIEWNPSSIKFLVNNTLQYTYTKSAAGGWQQWPFDVPFYLILNQAGGAGWPGPINNSALPFSMQVDYVRVYKLSLLGNGGFETASLSPWTTWGGTVTVASTDARSGSKAVRQVGGESAIEQVITGLSPNTTYKFTGFAKVSAAGQSVSIGAKNFGGTQLANTITSTAYTEGSVIFTTGASNTSATLYFYKAANGTVFGDDFYLEKQ